MTTHTKTPWSIRPAKVPNGIERSIDCAILDGDSEIVAECFEKVGRTSEGRFIERPALANAAFIVQAVNSHDALKEALKAAQEKLSIYRAFATGEYHGGMEYTALTKLIAAALALAEGREPCSK